MEAHFLVKCASIIISVEDGYIVFPKMEISSRIHKHWHGATADSWFSHLAIEVPGENYSNEWLESVNDDEYNILK